MYRKTRAGSRLAALILVAAAALTACGGSADTASDGGGGKTTVTVGVLPIVDVAPLYLGVDKGFFADEGLKLEIRPAQGGAALLPGVVSGDMQFAYSNVVSLMIAQQKGLPVQILTNGELSIPPGTEPPERTGQALLAAGDSGITSVEDLHGKKVAINTLDNINEVLVKRAIAARGGDPSKVNLVELSMSDMPAAIAEGRVAAAAMNEPFTSISLKQGAETIAKPFTDLEHPASNIAAYFAKDTYVQQNPDVVQGFVNALNKSLKYAQQHRDEVRKTLPSYTEIDSSLAERIVMPYWTPQLNRKSLDEIARLSAKYGVVDQQPNLDELIGKYASS